METSAVVRGQSIGEGVGGLAKSGSKTKHPFQQVLIMAGAEQNVDLDSSSWGTSSIAICQPRIGQSPPNTNPLGLVTCRDPPEPETVSTVLLFVCCSV